jgi:hypothetical protein
MATDRTILKAQQIGALKGTAAVSPEATVGQAHEQTFVFINAAGSPLAEVGITMLKACRVKSIRALPGSTLAVDATNFVTGTVAQRDGAGGSAVTIGTFKTETTGGAALTAFVPRTVTLVNAAVDIAAGAVLTYKLVDAATTTEPAVAVSVTVEYV